MAPQESDLEGLLRREEGLGVASSESLVSIHGDVFPTRQFVARPRERVQFPVLAPGTWTHFDSSSAVDENAGRRFSSAQDVTAGIATAPMAAARGRAESLCERRVDNIKPAATVASPMRPGSSASARK